MGKNLKGKELGKGISQRKDGRYSARFTTSDGKRVQKYFKKLQDCREWIANAQFADETGNYVAQDYTVDKWFDKWISVKEKSYKANTVMSYTKLYKTHIKPYLGSRKLKDLTKFDCQSVLNRMIDNKQKNTIMAVRKVLVNILKEAYKEGILTSQRCYSELDVTSTLKPKERRVLTIEETEKLLEGMKELKEYNAVALMLQTGMRIGELIGLKWSDVDFENDVVNIQRTAYKNEYGKMVTNLPKTQSGCRTIPLTKLAKKILVEQKQSTNGKIVSFENSQNVFTNENGEMCDPIRMDYTLDKVAKEVDIEHLSAHTLRHTFATRCIESGMSPKTLQLIMGHSKIEMTMNLYVHVTNEQKKIEMKLFEATNQ